MGQTSIKVSNVTPRCLTGMAGEKLLTAVRSALDKGDDVCLDFSDVTMFASLFFNNSIAKLIPELPPENLAKRVQVKNLNDTGKKALSRSLEVGGIFYKLDPQERENIEMIIKKSLSLWE
ncbi:STAS-like domain-containing protein [Gluconobacter kondonii]|uniref:STAS-like domain-containing protein n=1 Tax=Gluconobacter kondonii TaxID=941463 RepID=UPI001B8CEF5F|nr:STAS-like domain-containing protein [Gluconobacter kondonii]MBS1081727.1 STAS-like domain-containing protein [Gluconobacter kondonii]